MTDFSDRPWWIENKPIVNQNLKCEYCGRFQGQPIETYFGPSYLEIYKNHYERHLVGKPREITVCTGCHAGLHKKYYACVKRGTKLTKELSEREW